MAIHAPSFLNMTLADIRPPEDVPLLMEDVARDRRRFSTLEYGVTF